MTIDTHYVTNPRAFKRWRQFAMIKQDDLADRLGITQAVISRYEGAQAPVRMDRMELISREISAQLERDGIDAVCTVEMLTTCTTSTRRGALA